MKLIFNTIDNFKNDRSAALSPYLEKISEKIADLDKIINETTALQTISDGKLPKSGLDIENSVTASNHKNFTIGPNNERIIHNIARLPTNPTNKLNDYVENFLSSNLRSSLCQFLEEYTAFTDKGSYKSASFGLESSKNRNIIPKPVLEVMNLIHEKYSVDNVNHINSIHVTKFLGQSSHREQQTDYSPYLSPDSDIYNVFLGDSSTITFIDKCTNEESKHKVCDNSIYTTSVKSHNYWLYGIDRPSYSDRSVTYYLSFQCTHKNDQNSPIIIGDSNTHNISFYNKNLNNKSDLGRDIYGKVVKAFTIDEINPHDAIGYKNIIVQVEINNLKRKFANEYGVIDIDSTFDSWLHKIIDIKQICPSSRIIISLVMPTKIRELNDTAKQFNYRIFSCKNKFWDCLGFDSFLGENGLLDDNLGRYFSAVTVRRDRIHLGKLGISRLSLMIREAVLYPRQVVDRRLYSSVVGTSNRVRSHLINR